MCPFFVNVFPLSFTTQELDEGMEPPKRVELPIAEILKNAIEEKLEQMTPLRVPPECQFFEKDAGGRKKHSVKYRQA